MNATSAAARVREAQAELARAEYNLAQTAELWRRGLRRHRTAVLLGSGFASGLAVSLLPVRWWGRIGAVVGSVGAAAARSFLTPAFLGAAVGKLSGRANAERPVSAD